MLHQSDKEIHGTTRLRAPALSKTWRKYVPREGGSEIPKAWPDGGILSSPTSIGACKLLINNTYSVNSHFAEFSDNSWPSPLPRIA